MDTRANGMLLVWTGVEPAAEEDFNAWYDREHMAERLAVPGFLSARRYRAVTGDPPYFAAYDTESAEVLFSPAYLERLNNPTPWTERVMAAFRDTVRSVCRIAGEEGNEEPGAALTLRIVPAPGRHESLREALLDRLAPAPASARIRLCEAVQGSGETKEESLRGKDAGTTFALLLEGADAAALEALGQERFSDLRLTKMGAEGAVQRGLYRLLKSLNG